MRQHQETLTIETNGRGPVSITKHVASVIAGAGVQTGLCVILVQHTSASLVIQENADPSARGDLDRFLQKIAPENAAYYEHRAEGPDDMPSHIRSALTSTTETIPIANGQVALGTWQGIFLWEHRRRPHRRQVLVHILGE